MAIDAAFASLDETVDSTVFETINEGADYYQFDERRSVERDEKSETSSYHSTHLADENGLARDGKFRSSSTYVETSTDSSQPFILTAYYPDPDTVIESLTDSQSDLSTRVTKTTSETGSYYDVPLLFGLALRIQTGEYTIVETARETQQSVSFHEEAQGNVALGTVIEQDRRTRDLLEETSRVTTTGSYGPGGIRQEVDYATALVDREYEQYIYRYVSTGATTVTTERYALEVYNDNGEFSGHKYLRKWQVDANGTTELINPIVDEDLFPNQTAPEGPPPCPYPHLVHYLELAGDVDVGV